MANRIPEPHGNDEFEIGPSSSCQYQRTCQQCVDHQRNCKWHEGEGRCIDFFGAQQHDVFQLTSSCPTLSPDGENVAIIAGCVVGGACCLGFIAFFLWYWNRGRGQPRNRRAEPRIHRKRVPKRNRAVPPPRRQDPRTERNAEHHEIEMSRSEGKPLR